ncbi:expressed unknown protein (Partial), partial [Seminavis robusta]|eukprot:Sro550_g164620.1 n/a (272) ;mRNA; r:2-954
MQNTDNPQDDAVATTPVATINHTDHQDEAVNPHEQSDGSISIGFLMRAQEAPQQQSESEDHTDIESQGCMLSEDEDEDEEDSDDEADRPTNESSRVLQEGVSKEGGSDGDNDVESQCGLLSADEDDSEATETSGLLQVSLHSRRSQFSRQSLDMNDDSFNIDNEEERDPGVMADVPLMDEKEMEIGKKGTDEDSDEAEDQDNQSVMSDSEQDDMSTVDLDQQKEEEIKHSMMYGILSATGMMLIGKFITFVVKLCKRMNSSSDDATSANDNL